MNKLKRSGLFLLGFLVTFVLINSVISIDSIRFRFFSLSKINYDYIYLDWLKKFDLIYSDNNSQILFLGTSRTSYGIDPNEINNSLNLGFFSSSMYEVSQTARLLKLRNSSGINVIELNPIAFSNFHITMVQENEQDWLLGQLFKNNLFARKLALLPLIKYKKSIAAVWQTFLNPTLSMSTEKRQMRNAELMQIDNVNYKGFVSFKDITAPSDDIYNECTEMAEMSLDGAKSDQGIRLLTDLIANSNRDKLKFWFPPLNPNFKSANYATVKEQIISYLKTNRLEYADYENAFSPEYFFDCMHLNSLGAQKMTDLMKEVLK